MILPTQINVTQINVTCFRLFDFAFEDDYGLKPF